MIGSSRLLDKKDQVVEFFIKAAHAKVLFVAACAAAFWYSLPVFSMAYTEGFEPTIVLSAHAMQRGNLNLADAVYPFNGRFFLLTRLGASLVLFQLERVFPLTGLDLFRLLTVGSLVIIVGTIVALLWRIARIPAALSIFCCILFPPVFESAYLPNDDMLSGALVCIAVFLFWTQPTIARTIFTALLMGFAAVVRLDAILIAPAFVILLMSQVGGWTARVVRACILGIVVAGTPIIVYRLSGLSFFASFGAVSRGLRLWARPNTPLHNDVHTLILNVTVLGGLAWIFGVAAFIRARRFQELGLAVVVPLLYIVAYRSQFVEGRYLLPLAPFVIFTMAEGFRLVSSLRGISRTITVAALTLGTVLWIMPPPPVRHFSLIADPDGPRLVLGRAWNPLLVLWWEHQLNAGHAAIEAGVRRIAEAPDPVIVTGYWNADRLVALTLLEDGFNLEPTETPGACRDIADTFVRGNVVLLQIRTHLPFIRAYNDRLTWNKAGLPCLRAARPSTRRVLFFGAGTLDSSVVTILGPDVVYSSAHATAAPFVPAVASVLTGLAVAELPVHSVASALGPRLPSAELVAPAISVAHRATLLQ